MDKWKITSIVAVFTFILTGIFAFGHTQAAEVKVSQEPGKVVYWVLPGKRPLSKMVFGTPDNPKATVADKIKEARGPVKELLKKLPFLVGAPLKARGVNEAGDKFTVLKVPTLFSNKAMITSGEFYITYKDNQPYDMPGKPGATKDAVDLISKFTDPAGNKYELKVKHVIQPPIPGYETAGGVMTNAFHHGTTGTGSPLMPRVYTYAAFWGVGDVIVNGEVVDRNKVMHFMTTQTVRDKEYNLALDEDLPLKPENTIAGQIHHTHGVVLPIKATPKGPVFDPVKTAFKLPNGMRQPFIHIMYEQDTIVKGPFSYWKPHAQKQNTDEKGAYITVVGTEYSYSPATIVVKKGETVTINFRNEGSIAHNITLPELGVKSETILPGRSASVTFTPREKGTFSFWCSVAGHKDAGMTGKVKVVSNAGVQKVSEVKR